MHKHIVLFRSIICLCLRHRQIIDLHATDKSRYFAQPRPIIVYYLHYNAKITIIKDEFEAVSGRKKKIANIQVQLYCNANN